MAGFAGVTAQPGATFTNWETHIANYINLWAKQTTTEPDPWILVNWFYFRPKQIKKQQSKLDDLIAKCKNLNEQLEA